jgi:hypothetical protein
MSHFRPFCRPRLEWTRCLSIQAWTRVKWPPSFRRTMTRPPCNNAWVHIFHVQRRICNFQSLIHTLASRYILMNRAYLSSVRCGAWRFRKTQVVIFPRSLPARPSVRAHFQWRVCTPKWVTLSRSREPTCSAQQKWAMRPARKSCGGIEPLAVCLDP